MKSVSFFMALLLSFFISSSLLWAGGFKIEGDKFENLKMVFDKGDLSLSRAEKAARGYLEIHSKMALDGTIKRALEKVSLKKRKALLSPLLTPEGIKQVFGQEEAFGSLEEKLVPRLKFSYKMEKLAEKKVSSGEVHLSFRIFLESSQICNYCNGTTKADAGPQKDKPCAACRATGIQEMNLIQVTKLVLLLLGQEWKIRKVFQVCQECPEGNPKKCPTCHGRKNIPENSPRLLENLTQNFPPLPSGKADLSTAEKVVDEFIQRDNLMQTMQIRVIDELAPALNEFFQFFFDPSVLSKASPPAYQKITFRLPPAQEVEKGKKLLKASLLIEKGRTFQRRFTLLQGEGKEWKINRIEDQCWRCGGTGKDRFTVMINRPRYSCPNHPTFETYSKKGKCPLCGNKNLVRKKGKAPKAPCPECKGKGFVKTRFFL